MSCLVLGWVEVRVGIRIGKGPQVKSIEPSSYFSPGNEIEHGMTFTLLN